MLRERGLCSADNAAGICYRLRGPRTRAEPALGQATRCAGGWILSSLTLSWYQVLVIVAVALGFYLLELVLFLRVARRLSVSSAAHDQRFDALAAALAALREENSGLAAELAAVRRAPQSSGQYREAVEMAQQGLDSADVAENCGISRAEADLIVALHRSRAT